MASNKGIMSLPRPMSLNESYGAMQQSMAKSNPKASQAVNQALDRITPMLNKLDSKTLGLLLQLTQYLKDHKSQYKQVIAKLAAKGSLPPGVFPENYDPKFLSVFALSIAHAQQSRGMAAGGIADVAQHMKDQGRGKDTMLAHISPKEAELLRANGGVGTLNPTTGLPEFNVLDDIGNGLKGVGDFIGDILRPVGDVIGDILRSPIGLAATAAAGMYFLGTPTVSALASSALPGDAVLSAALPGDVAALAGEQVASLTPEAIAQLTPAAIESGMGTPGYGFNASAAESGLFNPANIGAGAASDFPTSGLTAKDILKKGKNLLSKDDEKEKQSDLNEMIKLMAMLEMINSQNQPKDLPVPKLSENSQLPYDSPVKKKSVYPSYVQTAADGGLMMDQRYDIGGVTADRTQTDYMTKMSAPTYRPGQGGITYFSPLVYKPLTTTGALPGQDTTKQAAIDELLNQVSRGGGDRGPNGYGSGNGLAQFGGSGFSGATIDQYGDSGPLTGTADYMNKLAAWLGDKGFTSISDAIAKNVDPNYGHEGRVGIRQAEANVLSQQDREDAAVRADAQAAAAQNAAIQESRSSYGGYSGGDGSGVDRGGSTGVGGEHFGYGSSAYAHGGITSLAEGGDTEEELRKRRSGGRGLSYEQQAEKDDPKAWANLTDEQKTEYYSNNPGMLRFSEGALNLWSKTPIGMIQNYFDPSRQDTQRKILETAKADAARYGVGDKGTASSGSLSSQIRGQDKANLRDLPYNAPVSGITSLDTKNPYIKDALKAQEVQNLSSSVDSGVVNPQISKAIKLSDSKEEIDKKLSLFNQGINPETGDSKVASGFNNIKNNTAAFLGNLGLTSLSDSIAKTVNSNYGNEGAVGLRIAEQAAQERAAREAAVERVVEQLERTEPPPAEPAAFYSRPAEIINIPSNENYGNEGRNSVAPDSLSDRSFSPNFGSTSYGQVAPGYTGGSEAARGGLLDSRYAHGGITALSGYNLGSYSDGGRLLRGPGDGVSDDIPAIIGNKQPARLANGEFVIPARIVSELGNGSTDAGAKRLYEMMARIQKVRRKTKNVAANTKAAKYLPA